MNRYDYYMIAGLAILTLILVSALTIMRDVSRQKAIDKSLMKEAVIEALDEHVFAYPE